MKFKELFTFARHRSGRNPSLSRKGICLLICFICEAFLFWLLQWPEDSKAEGDINQPEHGSLAEIGAKLSNPVSDVWALFTEFDLTFSDGDLNTGNAKIGARMIFQPILPLPLYGQGEQEWKLITRPNIPVLFSQPVPKSFDEFNNLGGLGDTHCPCWFPALQGIGFSVWDRHGCSRPLPGTNLGNSSGESARPLSPVITPRIGLRASSQSTPGVSEVGMAMISLTPAI
jgi:hypothetical protein